MKLFAVMVGVSLMVIFVSGCPVSIIRRAEAPARPPAAVHTAPATTLSAGVTPVDELAPDFTLQDTAGNPVTKGDFSGKILVLDFWATWCEPCKEKLQKYESIIAKYRDQGVELVAVSLDSTPQVAAGWARDVKSPFRIAMFDDTFKAAYFPEAHGAVPIPQVRILDRDGNLRFKFSSDSVVDDLDLALAQLVKEKVGGDEAAGHQTTGAPAPKAAGAAKTGAAKTGGK